uniref:TFR_dimer domain-containing protein n=1 Tax=Panagrellus redivivus TaxID=6233 RepID=A0A7E4V3Q8_PANRE
MVTSFKDLNDRVKTLGYLTHTMFEKYRHFMDGLPGQRGWESSLFDGERELRQTVAYIKYLDMVLAHADEQR